VVRRTCGFEQLTLRNTAEPRRRQRHRWSTTRKRIA
jgi:hypothetical protein